MRDFSILKKRIFKYIDYKGISKYEFYQKTGISNGVLSQKTGMSEENTLKLLNYYPEINPVWLLTGKGEMIKSKQDSLNQNIIGNENYTAGKDIIIDRENKALNKEIKVLKTQIIEKDLIIKTLIEQQKKLINKL